jgi:hypothetical protein
MINKIKDKQTGEYHDIGGLKCKLVAEGTLEWDDDNSCDTFNYNFEINKFYLFVLVEEEPYDNRYVLQHIFIHNESGSSIPYQYEGSWSGSMIRGEIFSKELTLYEGDSGETTSYAGVRYKIYELPFALGV